jgi:hypothetical protein
MTITAINSKTGARVTSIGVKDPRQEISGWQDLIDPISLAPVHPVRRHFRKGSIVQSFFRVERTAQWPSDVIKDSEYINSAGGIGESLEHLTTKVSVISMAHQIDPDLQQGLGTTELRIPIPGKSKYRIADVAFDLGHTIFVFEVQYSPITTNELTERTDDYFRAGCEVQWIFGPKNQKPEIEQWHESFIGFSAMFVYPSTNKTEPLRSENPYSSNAQEKSFYTHTQKVG